MQAIIEELRKNIIHDKYLYISEDIFRKIDAVSSLEILDAFEGKCMFRLPESEIKFNQWLKEVDFAVWDDLWGDNCDCDEDCGEDCKHGHHAPDGFDDLYYVSISLLPVVLNLDGRGLPICDLQRTPNYYFCIDNMVDEESKIIIEISQKLFRENKPMTVSQWLALEISIDPIDIWHFAYRHKIDLVEAKAAVAQLVEDDALVHLTEAEYLLPFIYF